MLEHYLSLATKAIFVENMALAFFLGMCSFLAVSKKVETAIGLGAAVIFVLGVTTPLNQLSERRPAEAGHVWRGPVCPTSTSASCTYLVLIGTIAAVVQMVEMSIDRFSPDLYNALGVFLPLIAVNCAILGGALFMVRARLHAGRGHGVRPRLGRRAGRSRSSPWPPSARSSATATSPNRCAASESRSWSSG